MDTVTDLVRWDVPFAEARDPSVGLITELGRPIPRPSVVATGIGFQLIHRPGDGATWLVVSPGGINKYPKYLVRFDKVIALLCYEEAHAFDRGYRTLRGIEDSVCAYRWIDSPWLRDYSRGADVFEWTDLRHYLVFGGDNIVELVVSGEPKVERIETRVFLETRHVV